MQHYDDDEAPLTHQRLTSAAPAQHRNHDTHANHVFTYSAHHTDAADTMKPASAHSSIIFPRCGEYLACSPPAITTHVCHAPRPLNTQRSMTAPSTSSSPARSRLISTRYPCGLCPRRAATRFCAASGHRDPNLDTVDHKPSAVPPLSPKGPSTMLKRLPTHCSPWAYCHPDAHRPRHLLEATNDLDTQISHRFSSLSHKTCISNNCVAELCVRTPSEIPSPSPRTPAHDGCPAKHLHARTPTDRHNSTTAASQPSGV